MSRGDLAARLAPFVIDRAKYPLIVVGIRGYYRDLLLLSQGAPEALLWNGDRMSALRTAAEQYTPEELLSAMDAVDRCRQFLDRNVSPQLALETLFLELLQPTSHVTATAGPFTR